MWVSIEEILEIIDICKEGNKITQKMNTNFMCILTGSRLFFEEKQVEMVKKSWK